MTWPKAFSNRCGLGSGSSFALNILVDHDLINAWTRPFQEILADAPICHFPRAFSGVVKITIPLFLWLHDTLPQISAAPHLNKNTSRPSSSSNHLLSLLVSRLILFHEKGHINRNSIFDSLAISYLNLEFIQLQCRRKQLQK